MTRAHTTLAIVLACSAMAYAVSLDQSLPHLHRAEVLGLHARSIALVYAIYERRTG